MRQVVLGIIFRENNGVKEYLLITAKKYFGKYTGLFYPCGGHVEEGENPKQALIREVKEELGIVIKPIRELAKTGSDIANQETYWWECEKVPFEIEMGIDDNKIASVRWLEKEYILANPSLFWPATNSFFASYFKSQLTNEL